MPFAADGDLPFLHRFEQCGLCLWRGAVDLVGEQHVGEDWSRQETQLAGARQLVLLDNLSAGDVGRHQIRRELDAVERQAERVGQGPNHQRLREAGYAHQQAMSAAEHRDQQFFDDSVLPDDDFRQLVRNALVAVGQLLHGSEIRVSRWFRRHVETPREHLHYFFFL